MIVNTPHGSFPITRRATIGFSVVRLTQPVRHRYCYREIGELVTIEHRKRPRCKALIGGPWCEWVATYDLEGKPMEVEG